MNEYSLSYFRLDDVPLPEVIYNGPLEEVVIPLVRAVSSHHTTTTGSCEGHLDRFFPYPWVQMFPYDDVRLLNLLLPHYNKKSDIPWKMECNVMRPSSEAKTLDELRILQKSVRPVAEFLFEWRPEMIHKKYTEKHKEDTRRD